LSKLYVNEVHSKTGSTKALEIDSSGRVLTPARPFINLQGNTSGEITVKGTPEVITDWTATTQGGMSYSNGQITVPVDGIYLITGFIYFWMNDTGEHSFQIRKNGTNIQDVYVDINHTGAGGRNDHTKPVSLALDLNASDYIDFRANGDIYGGSQHTNIQMFLVG